MLGIGVCSNARAATYTTPRALNVGDTYELARDSWTTPAGGGAYQGDVLPKDDPNTGTGGDNLYFVRQNVARAWATGTGYWYTVSEQADGEPDPAGEQWVDYMPPLELLGSGLYHIDACYRWAATRASYPGVYRVCHALGTNVVLRDQRLGSASSTTYWFAVGDFELRPGSFVRVEDTGSECITFANMRFRLITPTPTLKIEVREGACVLRWPTNAPAYRLESTVELSPTAFWESVFEQPVLDGQEFKVMTPWDTPPRFFRLVLP